MPRFGGAFFFALRLAPTFISEWGLGGAFNRLPRTRLNSGSFVGSDLPMPRQPFSPIRKRQPGGKVSVGNDIPGRMPELDALIGRCLMIWPPAEAEMALVLGLLLGAENAAAMAVFQSLRRSSSQREAIAEAGKIRLPPSDQDLLNAVLNVHKSIEAERNALAHGHFGMYSELKDSLLWMATVERREALRPASLGAHAPQAAPLGNQERTVGVQAGRSQGSPKGVSQTSGASRRSTALHDGGLRSAHRERGEVA